MPSMKIDVKNSAGNYTVQNVGVPLDNFYIGNSFVNEIAVGNTVSKASYKGDYQLFPANDVITCAYTLKDNTKVGLMKIHRDQSSSSSTEYVIPTATRNNIQTCSLYGKPTGSLYQLLKSSSNMEKVRTESLNISNVTSLKELFHGCSVLTSTDLSNFDTSKVTDMSAMFYNCNKLVYIYVSDLFVTTNVTQSANMFYQCLAIKGAFNTSYDNNFTDATYAREDTVITDDTNVTSQKGYFTKKYQKGVYAKLVETQPNSGGDSLYLSSTPNLNEIDTSLELTIRGCYNNQNQNDFVVNPDIISYTIWDNDKSYFETAHILDTIKPNSLICFFGGPQTSLDDPIIQYSKLLTTVDLSNLDTSNVTSLHGMFENCESLTSVNLSGFDTSKVTDMSDMFYNCTKLASLDLSNFNTSNVINMFAMFCYCSSLTSINISSFITSKVTNMKFLFLRMFKSYFIRCI